MPAGTQIQRSVGATDTEASSRSAFEASHSWLVRRTPDPEGS
jgi:hypothetical protein